MHLDNIPKLGPSELFKQLWGDKTLEPHNWLGWDPHTLLATVEGLNLPPLEQNKVLAVQHVGYNTAEVCTHARAFYAVCCAFNNEGFIIDGMLPLHIEEIFYAVKHIREISSVVHGAGTVDFAGEVPGYVASCAKYHGWVLLPADLSFAQDSLDHLTGVFADKEKVEHNKLMLEATVEFIKTVTPANIPADVLTSDTEDTIMRRKIIGAYLYDPTLLVSGASTPK